MPPEERYRLRREAAGHAARSSAAAGTETLLGWVDHVAERGGTEALFGLEVWLRGLRAFFTLEHLPLATGERRKLLDRSFAGELEAVRRGLQACELAVGAVACLGQPESAERHILEAPPRREWGGTRLLEQPTPLDSLARLVETLGDLQALIDAARPEAASCRFFLSLGRAFHRGLRDCRYVDLLLEHGFKKQYDRVEHPALAGVVRGIAQERLRQRVASVLLHFNRTLRSLRLVTADLTNDRPLREDLIVFALVHEEMGKIAELLSARAHERVPTEAPFDAACELVVRMLEPVAQHLLDRDLAGIARERDAAVIHRRIELGQALVRKSLQGSMVTLVEALDPALDAGALFPGFPPAAESARQFVRDLWRLRQAIRGLLADREGPAIDAVARRLVDLRAPALEILRQTDWQEFERLADALVTAQAPTELRAVLRGFVAWIEGFVAERADLPAEAPPAGSLSSGA